MKTYQILEPNDILQKGDEYLRTLIPPVWAATSQIGETASVILYRRPVVEQFQAVIEDKNATIRRLSEPLGAAYSPTVEYIKNLEAAVARLEQSLSTSQSANIAYAAVVSDRHDYTQKLEQDLSFYKEAVDAAVADTHFYRSVIDKVGGEQLIEKYGHEEL